MSGDMKASGDWQSSWRRLRSWDDEPVRQASARCRTVLVALPQVTMLRIWRVSFHRQPAACSIWQVPFRHRWVTGPTSRSRSTRPECRSPDAQGCSTGQEQSARQHFASGPVERSLASHPASRLRQAMSGQSVRRASLVTDMACCPARDDPCRGSWGSEIVSGRNDGQREQVQQILRAVAPGPIGEWTVR